MRNNVQQLKLLPAKLKIIVEQNGCIFCLKFKSEKLKGCQGECYTPLLNKALFTKYSTIPTNHIEQQFEELFLDSTIKWVYENTNKRDQEETFVKRFYNEFDQINKLGRLVQYYKYHINLPRNFMKKLSSITTYFYEKKKYLEYKKIRNMLGILEEVTETIRDDGDKSYNPDLHKANDNLLKDLTFKQRESLNSPSYFSTQSILKELIKNKNIVQPLDMSASWISMTDNDNNVTKTRNHMQTINSNKSPLLEANHQIHKLKKFLTQPQAQNMKDYVIDKQKGKQLQLSNEFKPDLKPIILIQTIAQNQIISAEKKSKQYQILKSPTHSQRKFKQVNLEKSRPSINIAQGRNASTLSYNEEKVTSYSNVMKKQESQVQLQHFLQQKQVNDDDFRKFLLNQLKNLNQPKEEIFQPQIIKTVTQHQQMKQFQQKIFHHHNSSTQIAIQQVQKQQMNSPIHHSNHKKSISLIGDSPSTSPTMNNKKRVNIKLNSTKRLNVILSPEVITPVKKKLAQHSHTSSLPNINNLQQVNLNSINLKTLKQWASLNQSDKQQVDKMIHELNQSSQKQIKIDSQQNQKQKQFQSVTPKQGKAITIFGYNKSLHTKIL